MLNDRDDKYEGQEDSEYHFSDEEVNYEVETESPKPVVATESKENIFSRLTQSKRMIISVVVFLVLVFVVYKMVTPSTVTPPTTITPVTTVQTTVQPAAQPPVATSPPVPVAPAAVMTQPTPVAPAPAVPSTPPTVAFTQPPTPTTTTTTVTTVPTQPMPQQPVAQQPIAAQQPMQPIAQPPQQTMPAVIPVQSTPPVAAGQLPATLEQQVPGGMATQLAQVSAESNQLANQAQAEYAQKINDYAAQNQMLQDQLQALNTRIASMESQMNQLIQAITQPPAPPTPPTVAAPTPPMPPLVPALPQVDGSRIGYNVQAIIPGRAWLRSESGETLTVAEGDLVKGIGRVTKIDPYDGVVEINTGTKVITLSYGAGG